MRTLGCLAIVLALSAIGRAGASGPGNSSPKVEIAAAQTSISTGDAVTLQLNCKFAQPQVTRKDPNLILTTWASEDLKIEIRRGGIRVAFLPVLPEALRLKGKEGREYTTAVILLYDHYTRKMIFDAPGEYTIVAMLGKTEASSATVSVSPADPKVQVPLSQLLEPLDFLLLEVGSSDSEKTRADGVSRLMKLSDQYPDTKIGRWAAARVGMEFYEAYLLQLQRKPGENETGGRTFGLSKEGLLEGAGRYLQRAKELEDSFPLREQSLFLLAGITPAKGDRDALLRELAAKYPSGRFGRLASQHLSSEAKK
jgi:hypothetical protein